jgi:large subunit ribosomal protein L9
VPFKEKKIVDDANKLAEALKGLNIKIASKVGTADKLFGSVNNIDVSAALNKAGHEVEKRYISIAGGSIKRLGKYNAVIRLHREVSVDLPFEIVAE